MTTTRQHTSDSQTPPQSACRCNAGCCHSGGGSPHTLPPACPSRGERALLRLFPRRWQQHYGDEFLSLLADQSPDWRDLFDIVRSAADARLRPAAWLPPQAIADTSPIRAQEAEPSSATVSGNSGAVITVGGRPRGGGSGSGGNGHGHGRGNGEDQRRFNRRQFLRNSLLGGVAVAAAAGGAAVLVYTQPGESKSPFGQPITVPAADIPQAGEPPLVHAAGRFFLINDDDRLLAIYRRCTHLHCTVDFEPGADVPFECPCHGSQYDRHGMVVRGPAERPLELMRIERAITGDLIIDTGDITSRDRFDPEQGFPL